MHNRSPLARPALAALALALAASCGRPAGPVPGARVDSQYNNTSATLPDTVPRDLPGTPEHDFFNGAYRGNDATLADGKTLKVFAEDGAVRFKLPASVDPGTYAVRVKARGDQWSAPDGTGPAPILELTTPGGPTTTNAIETTAYGTHTFGTYYLVPGQLLTFTFTNDYPPAGSGQDRNVYLDEVILSANELPGATVYVNDDAACDGSGQDPCNGSAALPFRTISAAVTAQEATGTPAKPTIIVKAGTYRETVTVREPLVLIGEAGAKIRGSDANGWNQNWTAGSGTGVYQHAYPVTIALPSYVPGGGNPNSGTHTQRCGTYLACAYRDQIFVDGLPLYQRDSLSGLTSGSVPPELDAYYGGQFYVTATDPKTVHVRLDSGSSPNGKLVEVTARDRWVVGVEKTGTNPSSPTGVVVRGFDMAHSATPEQTGGVYDGGFDGWVVEDNDLSYAHGGGVRLEGSNAKLRHNYVHLNGQIGVTTGRTGTTGAPPADHLVEGNEIAHNNIGGFRPGWEAGGTKFTRVLGLLATENHVHHNIGGGLWVDVYGNLTDTTKFAEFANNRVHHNTGNGIAFEISRRCKVHDNEVWENGHGNVGWQDGAGIMVKNSSNCEVWGNTLAWNADGIAVVLHPRGDNPRYPETSGGFEYSKVVVDNYVHDNVIMVKRRPADSAWTDPSNTTLLAWSTDYDDITVEHDNFYGTTANNRGSANRYYRVPDGTIYPRWDWEGTSYDYTLNDFNDSPGEQNGQIVPDSEPGDTRTEVLTAHDMPLLPECRSAGESTGCQ